MTPSYGVVIPAWNASETIAAAIRSAIAQTVPPARIIVVDDGSTDDTGAVAQNAADGVSVIRQDNRGPGAATSNGLRQLDCDVAALLDADDLWLPDKMARQIDLLAQRPEIDLVSCMMRQFRHGKADDGTGEVRPGPTRSTIVFRRGVFARVGDISDPPGNRGDMVDWIARFRDLGHREYALNDVLALRRIMPGSLSWGRDPGRDVGYLKVAHAALQRKRMGERGQG